MPKLQDLVDDLSISLNRRVSVDDSEFRLLAYSERIDDYDEVERQTILRRRGSAAAIEWVRAHHVTDCEKYVRVPASEELSMTATRIAVPIRRRDTLLGYLWIFDKDDSDTEDIVDKAVAAAAEIAELLTNQSILETDRHFREQAACSALLKSSIDADKAAEILDSPLFMRCAAFQAIAVELSDRSDAVHDRALLAIDRTRRHAPQGGFICGLVDGHPVVVIASESESKIRQVSGLVVADVSRTEAWRVAIGPAVPSLGDLGQSFHAALAALRVLGAAPELGNPVHWDSLGAWRLAACISDSSLLGVAVHPALARLEADPHSAVLIETLEAYLAHACNVGEAAKALYIHRASLYARLKRIETVGGVDLADGEERLALHMSMKVARLNI